MVRQNFLDAGWSCTFASSVTSPPPATFVGPAPQAAPKAKAAPVQPTTAVAFCNAGVQIVIDANDVAWIKGADEDWLALTPHMEDMLLRALPPHDMTEGRTAAGVHYCHLSATPSPGWQG